MASALPQTVSVTTVVRWPTRREMSSIGTPKPESGETGLCPLARRPVAFRETDDPAEVAPHVVRREGVSRVRAEDEIRGGRMAGLFLVESLEAA
ncbi:hypothetical protein Hesp01_24970 [Herbidospora sp. NBRC 101105]|nr:hypothetical protein Hesp01_24970 [Herbidospora sp. NBRC 101105]